MLNIKMFKKTAYVKSYVPVEKMKSSRFKTRIDLKCISNIISKFFTYLESLSLGDSKRFHNFKPSKAKFKVEFN